MKYRAMWPHKAHAVLRLFFLLALSGEPGGHVVAAVHLGSVEVRLAVLKHGGALGAAEALLVVRAARQLERGRLAVDGHHLFVAAAACRRARDRIIGGAEEAALVARKALAEKVALAHVARKALGVEILVLGDLDALLLDAVAALAAAMREGLGLKVILAVRDPGDAKVLLADKVHAARGARKARRVVHGIVARHVRAIANGTRAEQAVPLQSDPREHRWQNQ